MKNEHTIGNQMESPERHGGGNMKNFLLLVIISLLAFSPPASANSCAGQHKYKDLTLSVMKKSYKKMIFGYGSDTPPSANEIVWSYKKGRLSDGGKYQYELDSFSSFLSNLNAVDAPHAEKWSGMFATYSSEERRGCVLSVAMDVGKIKESFGETIFSTYIVYVNGEPFSSLENPYVFFYPGLDEDGYIDTSYH